MINVMEEFVKKWGCIMDVQRTIGLAHQNICKALNGKYSHCGGYKWGYADEYEKIPFKVFDLEIYRKKVA